MNEHSIVWFALLLLLSGCLIVSVFRRIRRQHRVEAQRCWAFAGRTFDATVLRPRMKRVRESFPLIARQHRLGQDSRSNNLARARRRLRHFAFFNRENRVGE